MQITGKTTITLKDKSLDGNCVNARYFANHLRQTRHWSQRGWGYISFILPRRSEDSSHVEDVDTSVDKHNRHNTWETDTPVGFRQIRNDEVYVSHVATQRDEYAPTSMYSIRLRHVHRRATHIPKL